MTAGDPHRRRRCAANWRPLARLLPLQQLHSRSLDRSLFAQRLSVLSVHRFDRHLIFQGIGWANHNKQSEHSTTKKAPSPALHSKQQLNTSNTHKKGGNMHCNVVSRRQWSSSARDPNPCPMDVHCPSLAFGHRSIKCIQRAYPLGVHRATMRRGNGSTTIDQQYQCPVGR